MSEKGKKRNKVFRLCNKAIESGNCQRLQLSFQTILKELALIWLLWDVSKLKRNTRRKRLGGCQRQTDRQCLWWSAWLCMSCMTDRLKWFPLAALGNRHSGGNNAETSSWPGHSLGIPISWTGRLFLKAEGRTGGREPGRPLHPLHPQHPARRCHRAHGVLAVSWLKVTAPISQFNYG